MPRKANARTLEVDDLIAQFQKAHVTKNEQADAERVATRPAEVQLAYATLQSVLSDRKKRRGGHLSAKEQTAERREDVGLDTASTYLLYASSEGAATLAATVAANPHEAEAFGQLFYAEIVVAVSKCEGTPAPSSHRGSPSTANGSEADGGEVDEAGGGEAGSSQHEEPIEGDAASSDENALNGDANAQDTPEKKSRARGSRAEQGCSQGVLRDRLFKVHCGRCPVTGKYADEWMLFGATLPRYLRNELYKMRFEGEKSAARFDPLIASHILRYALHSKPKSTWDLLQSFVGPRVDLEKYRKNIQATSNAVLLALGVDARFDRLQVWFEPDAAAFTRASNSESYWCTVGGPFCGNEGWPSRIEFTNFYAKNKSGVLFPEHDLPDPELLFLHSCLGKVLNSAGMADHMERLWRERDAVDALRSPKPDLHAWVDSVQQAFPPGHHRRGSSEIF